MCVCRTWGFLLFLLLSDLSWAYGISIIRGYGFKSRFSIISFNFFHSIVLNLAWLICKISKLFIRKQGFRRQSQIPKTQKVFLYFLDWPFCHATGQTNEILRKYAFAAYNAPYCIWSWSELSVWHSINPWLGLWI